MKKAIIIFSILGALVVLGYLYVRFSLLKTNAEVPVATSAIKPSSPLDLKPLIIEKINELIKKGSNGLYNFSADSLRLDVISSKAALYNVTLTPDTAVIEKLKSEQKLPDNVFKVFLGALQIEGINADDLLHKDHIDLKKIFLANPVVHVYHQQLAYNNKTKENKKTVYQRLLSQIKHLSVDTINVENGLVVDYNLQTGKTHSFKYVSAYIRDLLIDSSTQYDHDRFFFSKKAIISVKNYSFETADGLYTFQIGNLSVNAAAKDLEAENVHLIPNGGRKGFEKKLSYMKEMYTLKLPKVRLNNIDWWALANLDDLIADRLELDGGEFNVYLDRSLPASKSKLDNFPHQILMRMPLKTNVTSLNIHGFSITYEEYNPEVKRSGKIYFRNVDMEGKNITNIPGQIEKEQDITVQAKGKFLGQIPVKARFVFNLEGYKKGSFAVDASLDKLEGSMLNKITEPLGYFKIKSGTAELQSSHIAGDNYSAHGKVVLLYDSLHIVPLKVDTNQPGNLKSKPVTSLIANAFFIRNANPSNGKVRKPDCNYKRDPSGSFFNLIWKTILVGILKTVGIPEKYAQPK